MKIKMFLISVILLSAINVLAQTGNDVELADTMRSNGKIFVVVGVIAIVFTGILFYLIYIDRKVSKLEKKIEKHN